MENSGTRVVLVSGRWIRDALRRLVEADTWTEKIEGLGSRCERKPGGFAIH